MIMKLLKLFGIAAVLIGVIVLVVWLSNGMGHRTDPDHDNNYRLLTDYIDDQWAGLDGWNENVFDQCLEETDYKFNNGYITSEEKSLASDHLYNLAIKKTAEALDKLYADSSCKESNVKAQYAGIQRISANAKYAADSEVKKQTGIFNEYSAALNFLKASPSTDPKFRLPKSWANFDAGANNYQERAAVIKGNAYWDVISGISEISHGLAESTINSKVASAKSSFAANLSKAIMGAYKTPDYDQEQNLRDAAEKAYNEFPGEKKKLQGFVNDYINRLANSNEYN